PPDHRAELFEGANRAYHVLGGQDVRRLCDSSLEGRAGLSLAPEPYHEYPRPSSRWHLHLPGLWMSGVSSASSGNRRATNHSIGTKGGPTQPHGAPGVMPTPFTSCNGHVLVYIGRFPRLGGKAGGEWIGQWAVYGMRFRVIL